jgi:RNA polymerase sigma-70 factor, ECF subfamily
MSMSNLARYKRSPQAVPALRHTLPRALTDHELMRLVGERDAAAFAVLYRRHARAALTLALRLCGRPALAEEVVQEAFLSLWRSPGHYDGRLGSPRTWVLGVVHHRAIDARRGRAAHDRAWVSDEGIDERLEAKERTDREAGRRDAIREVRAVLQRLPPEQSRVIELAYYGGLSNSEIAAMLDTPVGTVKGRMRLGLSKMRTQLHPEQVLW